jgi:PAS domain S-box-containing protein
MKYVLSKRFDYLKTNIVLELTEDIDSRELDKSMNRLRENGYQLAIDDFGKGYSSFERIRNIGIEYIKIDKSFIDGLTENVDDLLILEAIIGMCNNLKIKVIAEGIETMEQLEFLYARKCMRIQGYIFNKPGPIENVKNELESELLSIKAKTKVLMSDDIDTKKFYNQGRIIRQEIDVDYNLIKPNIDLSEVLEYDYDVFINKNFINFIPNNKVKVFKNFIKSNKSSVNHQVVMMDLLTANKRLLKCVIVKKINMRLNKCSLYIEFIEDKNEMELLGLSHSYIQAFEEAPSGMLIVDSNFEVSKWNKSCYKIFGYTYEEMSNKNIIKVLSDETSRNSFHALFQKASTGNRIERVVENMTKDGSMRMIRWHVDTIYDELKKK